MKIKDNFNSFKSYLWPFCSSLLMLISADVAAKDVLADCEKMTSSTKIAQCLDYVKNKKDRELAIWVKNQSEVLSQLATKQGSKSALLMFKRSQQHFNNFREDNCRWYFLATDEQNHPASKYKTCYIKLTQRRINELKKSSN